VDMDQGAFEKTLDACLATDAEMLQYQIVSVYVCVCVHIYVCVYVQRCN
jgi:hypothetical protein